MSCPKFLTKLTFRLNVSRVNIIYMSNILDKYIPPQQQLEFRSVFFSATQNHCGPRSELRARARTDSVRATLQNCISVGNYPSIYTPQPHNSATEVRYTPEYINSGVCLSERKTIKVWGDQLATTFSPFWSMRWSTRWWIRPNLHILKYEVMDPPQPFPLLKYEVMDPLPPFPLSQKQKIYYYKNWTKNTCYTSLLQEEITCEFSEMPKKILRDAKEDPDVKACILQSRILEHAGFHISTVTKHWKQENNAFSVWNEENQEDIRAHTVDMMIYSNALWCNLQRI